MEARERESVEGEWVEERIMEQSFALLWESIMNLGVKPQTQEEVVECFFVSDVTTQKWKGL